MKLDEFIKLDTPFGKSQAIDHPDFDFLYMRIGKQCLLESSCICNCVTIANVQAKEPGKGAFSRLVHWLLEKDLTIYIENANNSRLRTKLVELGFEQVNYSTGYHYIINR